MRSRAVINVIKVSSSKFLFWRQVSMNLGSEIHHQHFLEFSVDESRDRD